MAADRKAVALVLATAIAVPMEGVRQWAYRDPIGLPTVCMGHTEGVKMGDFRTLPECRALLTQDMSYAIAITDACQPGLPTPILAAFSDLTFNAGSTAACDVAKSTAARYLKLKDYRAACDQLLRWTKARIAGVMVELPGLVKRRAMERELCLKGIA